MTIQEIATAVSEIYADLGEYVAELPEDSNWPKEVLDRLADLSNALDKLAGVEVSL